MFNNFSFMFFQLDTFEMYNQELIYLDFFYSINQKNKSVDSTIGILHSLTKAQRSLVFFVLREICQSKEKYVEEFVLWKKALFDTKASTFM